MYLQFFGFNRAPFHITPDPELLFLSPSHKEALAAITYGVEKRLGFIEIVGDVGLGKTTVLRSYLAGVEKRKIKPIVLYNPSITFAELLKTLYLNLDRKFPATIDQSELMDHFLGELIEEYRCNRNIVVIIDEAQNIPVETLEQLRMLSNLEAPKDKLLQIVLVGQPELDQKINTDGLRQLRQRIAMRVEILPLTGAQSSEYIKFRLSKVTNGNDPVFTQAAMNRIVKFCEGIPRRINVVCENAFITAFGHKTKPVSREIVDEVIGYLYGQNKSWRRRWLPIGAAAALVLLAASALLPFRKTILTKFQELRSGLVVYEDQLSQGSDKNPNNVQPAVDGSALPAVTAADPDPPDILPFIDAQTAKKRWNLPPVPEEKAPVKQVEKSIEVINDQTKAPLFDPSNAPVSFFGDIKFRQSDPPPESETTSNSDAGVPAQDVKSEVASPAIGEDRTDQGAILDIMDEIIQKRSGQ